MRLIDADKLSSRKFPAEAVSYERVEGWYGHGWNDAIDTIMEDEPSVPYGEWKVIGRNAPNNIWHVFCPKCNCDMFTEFTNYCPNCGEPKKEINFAELDMRGDEENE